MVCMMARLYHIIINEGNTLHSESLIYLWTDSELTQIIARILNTPSYHAITFFQS